MAAFMVVLFLFLQNLSPCSALNSEGTVICIHFNRMSVQFQSKFLQRMILEASERTGLALLRFRERVLRDPFGALSKWNDSETDIDPCSWFGVECSHGKVVIL